MNITQYALKYPKVIGFFLLLTIVGGVVAFYSLGKKEDAPFVIKTAVISVDYPGANPDEVEQLITEPIEVEVRKMRNIHKIRSESGFGYAKIKVELDPGTPAAEMPQLWDELRRKCLNVQATLPSEASPIRVADDFGDVYGLYWGLSGDAGYSDADLRQYAESIRRRLSSIEGVKSVALFGLQQEVVLLQLSLSELADYGVDVEDLTATLQSSNTLLNPGERSVGAQSLKVLAEGSYKTLSDIENQIVITRAGTEIRLGDVARVIHSYQEPATVLMRVNGDKAIGIGVSTEDGYDVVKVGSRVNERLDKILSTLPEGIELTPLYSEDIIAEQANIGFLLNLVESIVIVALIILLVMGVRAGAVISSSLIFSIGGTLLLMELFGGSLNRTSLAAFIIAMGMLVDNAIVVTDNAIVNMRRGVPRIKAIVDGAISPMWGLLGATLIAVISFLPLYLAESSVSEIISPLFVVLAISLGLSWILALTQTPLWANRYLPQIGVGQIKDPYNTPFYNRFASILERLIRYKWGVIVATCTLFVASLILMGELPKNFFPNMDKPYFRADCFMPEGYSIANTEETLSRMCNYLMEQPEVKCVSMTCGASPLRYYLASTSFGPIPNFGNILVELNDKRYSAEVEKRFSNYVADSFPDVMAKSSLFKLSPAVESLIEIGVWGESIDTLEKYTAVLLDSMNSIDMVNNVKSSWGNRVPLFVSNFSQERGGRLGVNRVVTANALRMMTTGIKVGEFREGVTVMPIVVKSMRADSGRLDDLKSIPIFAASGEVIPLNQVMKNFQVEYRYNRLNRYNSERIMSAMCDPVRNVNTSEAFNRVMESVEAIELPEGYEFIVLGEAESQAESNSALAAKLPITFILIFMILLFLFRDIKRPIVILLMLPLIFIGVALGLAVSGKMFDFFALLGLLGLIGMNIKNSIVLVDRIAVEAVGEASLTKAVIRATISRVVPVMLASGTTILGMVPLLFDAMFGGMAACIMGGLLVSALLTLFVLPVTYTLLS